MHSCPWANTHPLLLDYHDNEWGVPVHNDRKHFEFFVMDLFQAGLSWLTILKKRDGLRKAFDDFDFRQVARYSEDKIRSLLMDKAIIRNQMKIRATVANARKFLQVIDEFGSFDSYIWQFTGYRTVTHQFSDQNDLPVSTKESDLMSRDLKNRGFKFAGTTICYAYMQAAGMVNDHLTVCFRYTQVGS